jgi:hypothetical protein
MGDSVQNRSGRCGIVADARALFAVVAWTDGDTEEVDQFDPDVEVIKRASES